MTLAPGTIRHTVAFTLRDPDGAQDFLAAAQKLAAIPGVESFEILDEVSPKNGFSYGISMEFAGRDAYEAYNSHPDHVRFVEERWIPEVAEFLELDYESR